MGTIQYFHLLFAWLHSYSKFLYFTFCGRIRKDEKVSQEENEQGWYIIDRSEERKISDWKRTNNQLKQHQQFVHETTSFFLRSFDPHRCCCWYNWVKRLLLLYSSPFHDSSSSLLMSSITSLTHPISFLSSFPSPSFILVCQLFWSPSFSSLDETTKRASWTFISFPFYCSFLFQDCFAGNEECDWDWKEGKPGIWSKWEDCRSISWPALLSLLQYQPSICRLPPLLVSHVFRMMVDELELSYTSESYRHPHPAFHFPFLWGTLKHITTLLDGPSSVYSKL